LTGFEETEILGKKAYRRVLNFSRRNFIGEVYRFSVVDWILLDYVEPEKILKTLKPVKDVAEQRFLIPGREEKLIKKFFLFGLRGRVKILVFEEESSKIHPEFSDLIGIYREVLKR